MASKALAPQGDISPQNQVRLDELALTASNEYAQVLRRGREAIEHAIACGEALNEARKLVPAGRWVAWLSDNVTVSYATAMVHQRLARHQNLIRGHMARDDDINSIQAALTIIRDEHRFPARAITDADRQRMRDLRADGHKLSEIAVMYSVSESTVCRWTTREASAATREIEPDNTLVEITDEMIERLALWISRNLYAGKLEVNDQLRAMAVQALQSVLAPGAVGRRLR